MKNALVLGGGGARGAYEVGAIFALRELGYEYQIVTGTSIGAVNAFCCAVENFDKVKEVWSKLDFDSVINYDFKWKNKSLEMIFKCLFKGGFPIEPLEKMLREIIKEEDVRNSKIDVGIVYTENLFHYRPVIVKNIKEGEMHDYLLTSCSAAPFLKKRRLPGVKRKCYDGAYSDNLPVKLAMDMGAEKIIAIDILKCMRQKVKTDKIDYLVIKPSRKLGFFLDFSNKGILEMMELGYKDIMNNKESILGFIKR